MHFNTFVLSNLFVKVKLIISEREILCASNLTLSHIRRERWRILTSRKSFNCSVSPEPACLMCMSHPFTMLWISVSLWELVALFDKVPLFSFGQCCLLKAPCPSAWHYISIWQRSMKRCVLAWTCGIPSRTKQETTGMMSWGKPHCVGVFKVEVQRPVLRPEQVSSFVSAQLHTLMRADFWPKREFRCLNLQNYRNILLWRKHVFCSHRMSMMFASIDRWKSIWLMAEIKSIHMFK